MEKSKTGGGRFNPAEARVYFLACGRQEMECGGDYHDHLLIAVNEINSGAVQLEVMRRIDQGKSLLIDSGVYSLVMDHARRNNVSMDVALSLNPSEIDGFDALFDKYVALLTSIGPQVWGYIEIDIGGRENKIKTRSRLEALGLKPIPVYHPLIDGWDYFDELCSTYDRICFANMVHAEQDTRIKLRATLWQRHRQYPDVWIHILGITPSELMYAYPSTSADSSSWLNVVRWNGYNEHAMGKSMGGLPRNFQYKLTESAGERGSCKAKGMSAYGSYCLQLNWRNYFAEMEELGMNVHG